MRRMHMGLVKKRSVTINGHRTSYSLEEPFYDDLVAIAAARGMTLAALVAEIDTTRPKASNLSSALRLHVLEWVRVRRD
ncbi:putative DNA-binding ribbon-helix-helix protein [Aquamicrobium lusatiense]|uniref:Putative DNA-binding ribbon-helix-helix protein n=2 Tax=Phyllobacteriaceae TaxID=69277 RepID=A0A7W9VWJ4_9HYPH|nr:putative DNA-binding ribbon-helix-helix protein [Aquamicrobium lusatiense]